MTPGLKLLSGIGRFLFFLGLLPIAFANELSSTIDVPYVAVNVNIPYGVQVRQEQLFGLTGQRIGEAHHPETQLSKVTQVSAAKALKFHASQAGRHLRVHYGAPAALRSRSTWAGSISHVFQPGEPMGITLHRS